MATLLAKSLAVLGGLGGVSVVGGGIYYLTSENNSKTAEKNTKPTKANPSKKKISDLLKEDNNKSIIGDGDSSKWNEKWTAFKNAHSATAPAGDWKIEGWDNKKADDSGLRDFKNLCKANVQKDENTELLNKVKEYCVG